MAFGSILTNSWEEDKCTKKTQKHIQETKRK